MGSASGMIWRGGVLTALVLIACIGQAGADVTTERGSSTLRSHSTTVVVNE